MRSDEVVGPCFNTSSGRNGVSHHPVGMGKDKCLRDIHPGPNINRR